MLKRISSKNYEEFKALLGEAKRKSDPLWCKLFYRPLSFPIGWLLYKMGMKANYVSISSIFLSSIAAFILIFGSPNASLIASLLMVLIALLDCIDGNIARARGETGPGGDWMDALSGYTVYALFPLALGIHIYLHNPYPAFPGLWIIIGALTSIANLFPRLLYQKFINSKLDKTIQKGSAGSRGSAFSKLSGEMGLVGWMMPALFVACVSDFLGVYLAFYCFFYVMSAILVTIILGLKVA